MNSSQITASKFIVLIGTLRLVGFTLFPPRCTINQNGEVTREKSAFLYSKMFHFVERSMPPNGSTRQYCDATGKIWQTTSGYDPTQVDWTRYALGAILIAVLTFSVAFLTSPSAARINTD